MLEKYITYVVKFNISDVEEIEITGDNIENLKRALSEKGIIEIGGNLYNAAFFVSATRKSDVSPEDIAQKMLEDAKNKLQESRFRLEMYRKAREVNERYGRVYDESEKVAEVETQEMIIKEIERDLSQVTKKIL